MTTDRATADHEALQCYTLAHGHPSFIHQHVVDAWAAQHADARTKPIGLVFALIGLHLHVDKGLSGREVQRAHMALAQERRQWPSVPLPVERGTVTATTVMAAAAGPERDKAIDAWCASVWAAFRDSHETIAALATRFGPRG
jgi:hypothetical protein